MDRKKISEWLEIAIAALFIAILVIGPLVLGAVRPREYVILQWLTVGIAVLWIVRLWLSSRLRLLSPPTCWTVLAVVAYAVWRYRTSDVEYAARQELVQVIVLGVLFVAFVNNLYSQDRILWVSGALILLATLVSMYGVYQWLTKSDHVWHFMRSAYEGRGSGTYISPNHLAGFLEMILPLAIGLLIVSRLGALKRVLLGYAALVIMIGIASTGSRGGWIATAVGTLLLGTLLLRTRRQLWSALAVLIVVGGIGMSLYGRVIQPRMQSSSNETVPDDIRFRIWKSSRAMWNDHRLFGVGLNHFDIRYRAYRVEHWEMFMRPGYAHNDYLNTLVDWGTVGLALILAPLAVAGWGVARSWSFLQRTGGEPRQKGGNRLGFVLGSAAGLLAILAHSFFDFNLHIPANAIIATTLLAILTTHWRFATDRYWLPAPWFVKGAVTLLLAGGAFYLSSDAMAKTREAAALRVAERAVPGTLDEIAALKHAFAAEPRNFETAYMIGERLRAISFMGRDDSDATAREALEWYQRALALNKWDSRSYIGCGMCLDWTSRHADADPYFQKAVQLDPNHFQPRAMMGWHRFQQERYEESIQWFDRSLKLNNSGRNSIAYTYRPLALKEVAARATPKTK
ncbi:MAG TPA: O-antigen ligase family protein [Candidatus Acidoferrum sp.]|nr:O-antigen ligase family protein [Candidatus Acidoferrum sp.]